MRISDWSSDVVLFRSHLWLCPRLNRRPDSRCTASGTCRRWGCEGVPRNREWHKERSQGAGEGAQGAGSRGYARSEEHTSELQSLMRISYAVFCLKKKIQKTQLNLIVIYT